MSSYNDIANRIAGIITSPDSAIGAMTGVYSVAKDFGYLVRGYLDTDSINIRETEKIRMAYAIRYGVLQNKNLVKTIDTIFTIFNKYTPVRFHDKIYSRTISAVAGRAVTNSIISTKLASSIAQNGSFLRKVIIKSL